MTRPARFPQVALVPGGNFAEPPSGVQLGGWPVGAVFPSSDANWLLRQITDWVRDGDGFGLRATDALAAVPCRVSTSILDIYDGAGATLTATITTGGIYYHGVAGRIDLTDAPTAYSGGNALVFPPSSVSYVLARPQAGTSGGPISGSSCAELLVSAVQPVAGYATLLQVTTDATDITASITHSGVSSYLEWGKLTNFTLGLRGTDAVLSGSLTAATGVFGGDAGGSDTLQVVGLAGGAGLVASAASTGRAVWAVQAATGPAGYFDTSAGAGSAIEAHGNTTSPAIYAVGRVNVSTPASSYGLQVGGSGNVDNMLSSNASGTGRGFLCVGSATGGEGGYFDHLRATGSAYSVYARTAAAADATCEAICGEGRSAGNGVHGKAVTGSGVVGEVSNNAGVAFRAETRTADTTYGFSGGFMFNANAAVNQWRATISGFAGVKSFAWYGPGSFLHAYEVTTGPIADSNVFDLAWPTVTALAAEGNGFYGAALGARIRIRVTFDARCVAAVASGVDIRLTDETNGGSTIVERSGAGTGTTAGWALPLAATDWQRRIAFECEYAPPNDGDLSIKLKVKRNTGGQISTRDIVVEFLGTFAT